MVEYDKTLKKQNSLLNPKIGMSMFGKSSCNSADCNSNYIPTKNNTRYKFQTKL